MGAPLRLDIDLCDTSGNVCVQLHGLAARNMESAAEQTDDAFDTEFYEKLIADIVTRELSIDDAVEIG
jgi:hypothetical protein